VGGGAEKIARSAILMNVFANIPRWNFDRAAGSQYQLRGERTKKKDGIKPSFLRRDAAANYAGIVERGIT
jgi:hypothetical protein